MMIMMMMMKKKFIQLSSVQELITIKIHHKLIYNINQYTIISNFNNSHCNNFSNSNINYSSNNNYNNHF